MKPSTNTVRNSTPILNREGHGDQNQWYQIEVSGVHPAGEYGVQIIDDTARSSIVEQFNRSVTSAGVMVDADHLSHDDRQKTEAYGWLLEVREKGGQLEGRIEWTDIGQSAIQNKRYKFFSSEYNQIETVEKGKVRPLSLSGLALTNRPNNKGGRPIKNKQSATTSTPADDREGVQTTEESMKTIAEQLGLAPEATEEEILAKITELQTMVSEMEEKEADTEAEEILNRHSKKFPAAQREQWKEQLLTNREGTQKLLEGLPEPATAKKSATPPLKNRATAPAPITNGAEEDKGAEQKRFVQSLKIKNRCTHSEAWSLAKQEKPELFS